MDNNEFTPKTFRAPTHIVPIPGTDEFSVRRNTWTNTELHNAKNMLGFHIEEWLKPFMMEYGLRHDQIQIDVTPTGVGITIKL